MVTSFPSNEQDQLMETSGKAKVTEGTFDVIFAFGQKQM